MKHSFKNPRYKICFQTKNKVWIYKNSRLRNFYNLRSKIVLKKSKFYKNFLITRNMKWTVSRRQMVPYFRKKKKFVFFYKNLFFTKQKLKTFYGGLKEYQMRNIFKKVWNKEQFYRTNIFLGALEQRIGMIFFRMRLLPTIFACNQLIKHHGILVNDEMITFYNYKVNLGDIVSIPKIQWDIFFEFLFDRLLNRSFGQGLVLWRKGFVLKKIVFYHLKKKFFYVANLKIFKIFKRLENRYLKFKSTLLEFKKDFIKTNSKFQNILTFFQIYLLTTYDRKFKKLTNNLKHIRNWVHPKYGEIINYLIFNIYSLKYSLKKISFLFSQVLFFKSIQTLSSSLKNNENLKEFLLEYPQNWELKRNQFLVQLQNLFRKRLKKVSTNKKNWLKYKKHIIFLLRKLRFRKKKKHIYKSWCNKIHWYIPNYLEIDYLTLRVSCIHYPDVNDIHYGFLCSFKKIIAFYKERAL